MTLARPWPRRRGTSRRARRSAPGSAAPRLSGPAPIPPRRRGGAVGAGPAGGPPGPRWPGWPSACSRSGPAWRRGFLLSYDMVFVPGSAVLSGAARADRRAAACRAQRCRRSRSPSLAAARRHPAEAHPAADLRRGLLGRGRAARRPAGARAAGARRCWPAWSAGSSTPGIPTWPSGC